MKAYLFGWNPIKFKWEDLDDDIAKLNAGEKLEEDWSCASHKPSNTATGHTSFV